MIYSPKCDDCNKEKSLNELSPCEECMAYVTGSDYEPVLRCEECLHRHLAHHLFVEEYK